LVFPRYHFSFVIPAKAGIHGDPSKGLDPSFRRDDGLLEHRKQFDLKNKMGKDSRPSPFVVLQERLAASSRF
jgi:hypothetical protein